MSCSKASQVFSKLSWGMGGRGLGDRKGTPDYPARGRPQEEPERSAGPTRATSGLEKEGGA